MLAILLAIVFWVRHLFRPSIIGVPHFFRVPHGSTLHPTAVQAYVVQVGGQQPQSKLALLRQASGSARGPFASAAHAAHALDSGPPRRFGFICGTHFSGTSILHYTVGMHPDVSIMKGLAPLRQARARPLPAFRPPGPLPAGASPARPFRSAPHAAATADGQRCPTRGRMRARTSKRCCPPRTRWAGNSSRRWAWSRPAWRRWGATLRWTRPSGISPRRPLSSLPARRPGQSARSPPAVRPRLRPPLH